MVTAVSTTGQSPLGGPLETSAHTDLDYTGLPRNLFVLALTALYRGHRRGLQQPSGSGVGEQTSPEPALGTNSPGWVPALNSDTLVTQPYTCILHAATVSLVTACARRDA